VAEAGQWAEAVIEMLESSRAALELAGIEDIAHSRGWSAQLDLEFAAREGRTFLARRQHVGPLLVQRAFHPEGDTCHVYIVHPPGGVVGGDDLSISVHASPHAQALLTTPAATKFYRSTSAIANQRQHLTARAATLEWLPQESIFYRDSSARSSTIVQLDADSKFIGWEIPCLGLPARNEPFDRGQLRLAMEVWVDGTPRFIDRLHIDGAHRSRSAPWGLAGFDALGTLLAYPATSAAVDQVRELQLSDVEVAITLVDGVLVCRCLSAQAEPVKRAFIAIWQVLRPLLLNRPSVLPRIWAT
jgi:urease accessory protein